MHKRRQAPLLLAKLSNNLAEATTGVRTLNATNSSPNNAAYKKVSCMWRSLLGVRLPTTIGVVQIAQYPRAHGGVRRIVGESGLEKHQSKQNRPASRALPGGG